VVYEGVLDGGGLVGWPLVLQVPMMGPSVATWPIASLRHVGVALRSEPRLKALESLRGIYMLK